MSVRLQWETDGARWPHRHASRFVEGGGYNDMFGYAWSPANRPRALSPEATIR